MLRWGFEDHSVRYDITSQEQNVQVGVVISKLFKHDANSCNGGIATKLTEVSGGIKFVSATI